MDQGILECVKHHYKHNLLLHILQEETDLNSEEFSKTLSIEDMSAKCWSEISCDTLAKSWNKLWPSDENEPDVSDDSDIESVLERMDVSRDVRVDWLAANSHEQDYYEYDDDKIARGKDDSEKEVVSIDVPISHSQACKCT